MDRSYTLPTLVENRKNFSNDTTYGQKIEEQWGKIHLQKMKNKMYVKNLTRVWESNQLWNILHLTYEILRGIVKKMRVQDFRWFGIFHTDHCDERGVSFTGITMFIWSIFKKISISFAHSWLQVYIMFQKRQAFIFLSKFREEILSAVRNVLYLYYKIEWSCFSSGKRYEIALSLSLRKTTRKRSVKYIT